MLKEMTSQAAKLEVRELLGYSVFPDPDQVEKAVSLYKAEGGSKLYGYVRRGFSSALSAVIFSGMKLRSDILPYSRRTGGKAMDGG